MEMQFVRRLQEQILFSLFDFSNMVYGSLGVIIIFIPAFNLVCCIVFPSQ